LLISFSANDYEYEYGQTETPQGKNVDPAVALAIFSDSAAAPGPVQEYAQESSYSLDPPVENLSASLAQTNLSTVNEGQLVAPTPQNTVNYNTGREGSHSFAAGKPIFFPFISITKDSGSNSKTLLRTEQTKNQR